MYTAEQYAKLAQLYVESLERCKMLEELYRNASEKLNASEKSKENQMPWDEEK